MRASVPARMQVKAAGGIRNLDDALALHGGGRHTPGHVVDGHHPGRRRGHRLLTSARLTGVCGAAEQERGAARGRVSRAGPGAAPTAPTRTKPTAATGPVVGRHTTASSPASTTSHLRRVGQGQRLAVVAQAAAGRAGRRVLAHGGHDTVGALGRAVTAPAGGGAGGEPARQRGRFHLGHGERRARMILVGALGAGRRRRGGRHGRRERCLGRGQQRRGRRGGRLRGRRDRGRRGRGRRRCDRRRGGRRHRGRGGRRRRWWSWVRPWSVGVPPGALGPGLVTRPAVPGAAVRLGPTA